MRDRGPLGTATADDDVTADDAAPDVEGSAATGDDDVKLPPAPKKTPPRD